MQSTIWTTLYLSGRFFVVLRVRRFLPGVTSACQDGHENIDESEHRSAWRAMSRNCCTGGSTSWLRCVGLLVTLIARVAAFLQANVAAAVLQVVLVAAAQTQACNLFVVKASRVLRFSSVAAGCSYGKSYRWRLRCPRVAIACRFLGLRVSRASSCGAVRRVGPLPVSARATRRALFSVVEQAAKPGEDALRQGPRPQYFAACNALRRSHFIDSSTPESTTRCSARVATRARNQRAILKSQRPRPDRHTSNATAQQRCSAVLRRRRDQRRPGPAALAHRRVTSDE